MKRKTSTDLIELVETHALALSLKRLSASGQPYRGWKRALFHAIQLSEVETGWNDLEKIRVALNLP